MTRPTKHAIQTAAEANRILVEWGRADLTVEAPQAQRWKEQEVFGTGSDWPSTSGEAAAQLRVALTPRPRDFETAILVAFQAGADINVRRVREVLRARVDRLQEMLGRAEFPVTRADRLVFPGHTRGQADEALRSDLIAVMATGDEPEDPEFLPRLAERAADARARAALQSVLGFDFDQALFLSLVNLNVQASVIDSAREDDLRWALRMATVLIGSIEVLYHWGKVFGFTDEALWIAWDALGTSRSTDKTAPVTVAAGALLAAIGMVPNVHEIVERQARQFAKHAEDKNLQLQAVKQYPELHSQLGRNLSTMSDEEKASLRAFIDEHVQASPVFPARITADAQADRDQPETSEQTEH